MKIVDKIIGGVALVALLFSLVFYSIRNVWNLVNWLTLGLGIIGLAYFLYVYFTKREKGISVRNLQYGSGVLIQGLIVFGIVALLAFITVRQHFRSDWTKNKLYSLADQTDKILEGLDRDVQILAFYKGADQAAVRDILEEYAFRSPKLKYKFVDPDQQVQLIRQYEIRNYNTIVVECGLKREKVEEFNESNLTNAILKVTREQEKVVYFLSGHGERSITDAGVEGYKSAAEAIQKENYQVRDLNLIMNIAQGKGIPDSCTVLAIVNPLSNMLPVEFDTIKSYLDRGNKAIILLDPEHQDDLAAFLAGYKVNVGRDLVVDASGMGQIVGTGPGMPLVGEYDQSIAITKGFGVMTFYPYTSSITPQADAGGYNIKSLLKTTPNSWAEVDFAATSKEVSFDENKDKPGPITIGVLIEKPVGNKKLSLVIIGDSDFAKNGYWGKLGNADLFLNIINFLAEEEDLISIRPKDLDDSRLNMTAANVKTVFYLIFAIPVLVIIGGVVFYIKRSR